MKKLLPICAIAAMAFVAGLGTAAMAETSLTLSPGTPCDGIADPCFDGEYVSPVFGDAAPGFIVGSLAQDGGPNKTTIYVSPIAMFGGAPVTLGDIESMSYWTKKDSTHAVDVPDWYLTIYTKPFSGSPGSSWYGERINSEPYFSVDMADPADTWNQWSTGGANNRLRFYDSSNGYFGAYTDPTWDTFVAGFGLVGETYSTQEVMLFAISTGSGWTDGFIGQVDGLRVELYDGSVATLNLEASQFLSCDPNATWKNHGQFVRCVAQEVNNLVRDGLMSREEADGLVSDAGQSPIGQ